MTRWTAVHPRVRGAHPNPKKEGGVRAGPSPRARGSRGEGGGGGGSARSIPACAGLTRGRGARGVGAAVHPRVRGAHRTRFCVSAPFRGPSPRARGSRERRDRPARGPRSIPACAGLTQQPRPRVAAVRSIPACAGLTPPAARACTCAAVHPRVRGAHWSRSWPTSHRGGPSPRARGSPHAPAIVLVVGGPSPRARGSRHGRPKRRRRRRSIPACAGLTDRERSGALPVPVHPRVRGAHTASFVTAFENSGPSPRARGSPAAGTSSPRGSRSIPACAGLTGGRYQ